jgi:hypothetical protein
MAMWSKYGIVHSYTIEAGYNMCSTLAKMQYPEGDPPADLEPYLEYAESLTGTGKQVGLLSSSLSKDFGRVCRSLQIDYQTATYYFTQRDYEFVGRELCATLLDLIDRNPVTRLASSPLVNLRVKSV